jgi:hypothetical protein
MDATAMKVTEVTEKVTDSTSVGHLKHWPQTAPQKPKGDRGDRQYPAEAQNISEVVVRVA